MKVVAKLVAKIFSKNPGKVDLFGRGFSRGRKHNPLPPKWRKHPLDKDYDCADWTY
jgi:hypothetical protein